MWNGPENDAQAAILSVMRSHPGSSVPTQELVDEAVRRWMRGQLERLLSVRALRLELGKVSCVSQSEASDV